MDFSNHHTLLGDIGATNVRFALLSNGALGPIKCFTVTDFPRFTDAVDAFLFSHCRQVSVVREALLAVAGPVEKDRCVLTNSGWTIEAPELCATFSFAKVHVLNDFEQPPCHCRSSRRQICIQLEVGRLYWGLRWRCSDPEPGSV
jgi:glucokinase